MKKDLPENIVEGVAIAVVLTSESPEFKNWTVYLVNLKNDILENVMISSKGYGEKDGKKVQTSVLRHSLGNVLPQSFVGVEAIAPEVLGLTNEYWLSYYLNNVMYDKKFIFLPESIVDENLIRIPLVNKPGVMIK
ncbi:hypothetical protein OQX61_21540 [Pedobacter sp. PLR]|uniref:hypothetical protein n=1 Tax=Pedobacter sp. PLR TaxID=2994465 RepID=UPI002247C68C|nr:hypothetical protein [Pedobacter sp. PLR]MCX2453866.1 hypothetical protein [Pedobacter sp. PLR]